LWCALAQDSSRVHPPEHIAVQWQRNSGRLRPGDIDCYGITACRRETIICADFARGFALQSGERLDLVHHGPCGCTTTCGASGGAVLAGRSLTQRLRNSSTATPPKRKRPWCTVDLTMARYAAGLLRSVLHQLLRKPVDERELEALLIIALYQLAFTRAAPMRCQPGRDCGVRQGWPWQRNGKRGIAKVSA